jgi:hypothetical protein
MTKFEKHYVRKCCKINSPRRKKMLFVRLFLIDLEKNFWALVPSCLFSGTKPKIFLFKKSLCILENLTYNWPSQNYVVFISLFSEINIWLPLISVCELLLLIINLYPAAAQLNKEKLHLLFGETPNRQSIKGLFLRQTG